MMCSPGEIETDEDWNERLIQIIQGKPAIYNKGMIEHLDRKTISHLWTEVCEAMVPLWHDMTLYEKAMKGKEIQQRWRNLRTCFKRELNKQKNSKPGPASKKRRKYIYFDQLLFLLPTMEDWETVSESSPPRMEGDDSENADEHTDETTHYQPHGNSAGKQKKKAPSYEESLLSTLKEQKTEEIDEDKLFLLSLVPSFKKMTDDQKLEAKMEFLSVIRRVTQPKPAQSAT